MQNSAWINLVHPPGMTVLPILIFLLIFKLLRSQEASSISHASSLFGEAENLTFLVQIHLSNLFNYPTI